MICTINWNPWFALLERSSARHSEDRSLLEHTVVQQRSQITFVQEWQKEQSTLGTYKNDQGCNDDIGFWCKNDLNTEVLLNPKSRMTCITWHAEHNLNVSALQTVCPSNLMILHSFVSGYKGFRATCRSHLLGCSKSGWKCNKTTQNNNPEDQNPQ